MSDPVEPTQVVAEIPTPAAEPLVEEPYDKERAMLLIEKLRSEVKDLKPKAKKADDMEVAEKARKDAELPEIERLKKEAKDLQNQLKKLEVTTKRAEVARKVGLPDVLADRIQGETSEEMEADAKLIFDALPKGPKPPPTVSPTNPGGAVIGETVAQQSARIHGSGANMYDPAVVRKMGGGVMAPEPKT
jgi:seryl-tRNA synthetase